MKYIRISGLLLGLFGGYLYWHFWACTNGCAITSQWYKSMIWGGILGYLISDLITDILKKNQKKMG